MNIDNSSEADPKKAAEAMDVPETAPMDFPDERSNATSNYGEKVEDDLSVSKAKHYDTKGGTVVGFVPSAADKGPDEQPSAVDTNIEEPPFDPAIGGGGEGGDPTALNIDDDPSLQTFDEPPFDQTPRIEEEKEPEDEVEVVTSNSHMQQEDPLLPIVTARLVEDSSSDGFDQEESQGQVQPDGILVDAKPLEREHFCRTILRSRTALFGIALLLLIVAGLGIGLGVTLGTSSQDETSAPSSSPTAAPISISDVRNVILDIFPSAAASLNENETSSSARRKALQWVFEDPSVSTYNESRIVQRWILATYYYATSGDSWKTKAGWLATNNDGIGADNECLWFGLSCNETDDLSVGITSLNMDANKINGTLPPEIAWFNESLMFIQLKDNSIKGPIPSEIGHMSKLKRITLRINDMTGPIPTELGLLKDLEVLRVDQNKFTGEIPSELGSLQKLFLLNIRGNKLCGDMPQEICNLRSDKLKTLQADCKRSRINCTSTCCTKCWTAKDPNCTSKG